MSSILLNKNGVPNSGTVMVKMECEVSTLSEAINLQLAVERRSRSVKLLEVATCGSTGIHTNQNGSGSPKQVVGMKSKKRKKSTKISKSKSEDSRAVWKKDIKQNRKVLDISATLKNLGLSEKQLMSMSTKMGTLENSLKCTIRGKKYWSKTARK